MRYSILILITIFIIQDVFGSSYVVKSALNFGNITYSSQSSFQIISNNNLLSSDGISFNKNNISSAVIIIRGKPLENITLSHDSSVSLISGVDVEDIFLPSSQNIVLDANGFAEITLLATLRINEINRTGSYSSNIQLKITPENGVTNSISIPVFATLSYTPKQTIIRNLNFGNISIYNNTSCSVVIQIGNKVTNNGCPKISGGSSLLFNFTGVPLFTVNTPTTIILSKSNGKRITANLITNKKTTGLLQQEVEVGATLIIPKGTEGGIYSGTFTITVNL